MRFRELPKAPIAPVRVLEERRGPTEAGFLNLVRRRLTLDQASGGSGTPFVYDCVEREAMDAVVVLAHHPGDAGVPEVWLRSAVRPPVALRPGCSEPGAPGGVFWELPAGLVEPEESSPAGRLRAACRELLEETGFSVEPAALQPLGAPTFPVPAVLAERHYFFHVQVDPARRRSPTLDGSELERAFALASVPLPLLLEFARRGDLPDAKTELGLRRLAEVLG